MNGIVGNDYYMTRVQKSHTNLKRFFLANSMYFCQPASTSFYYIILLKEYNFDISYINLNMLML